MQRERERQKRRDERAKRKSDRRDLKQESDAALAPGVDPDIAHIVHGPQPLPWDDEEVAVEDGDPPAEAQP